MNITRLPSGNYRARIYIGEVDGVKKFKTFIDSDKKQLTKTASTYEFSLRYTKPNKNDLTAREAIIDFINGRKNILSPTTILGYEKLLKAHFVNILDLSLTKLTRNIIQGEINKEALAYSPKTIKNAVGLLSASVKEYYPELFINLRLPKAQQKNKVLPTDNQIKTLLEKVKNTDMELAIILASLGSLRRSEVCALTTDDIAGNTITINKTTVDIGGVALTKNTTKNYLSRQIELPSFVIQMLKRKTGRIVELKPNELTSRFIRLRDSCQLTFCFHDLRHYYASTLHALGVPDQYVAERGGWNNTKTLQQIYQHTILEKENEINSVTIEHFSNVFDKKQENES